MTKPTWTDEDSAAAVAEGWDIFLINGDDNLPEIEKHDEGPSPFETDHDAVAHVRRRAKEGSPLHIKAMELNALTNPKELTE